ncbi:hypothetical protein BST95_06405 [Halioglobus japonicus]|uniref:Type 4 fimbrial biogenesis protein PilX N-terminal domain-containing protein n=1 Tax=Halioglobus japonicus TaxID=930805 RepID=A0AAP8MDL9_9GAMM|nr:pilus assembly PilX N-terminal domain-containing protein [Halioglobus japonicus]AQA17923.1 hypothetical protein BST95_06405 [Halioglobus japonicus]PLW85885.1 hypothetical protein C0029_14960 [Halioglobus japonicus]GHD18010.1 hypothetical protein GCM10007052_25160 [Halioglobus japonicus]
MLKSYKHQSGIALATALLFLLVVTIIAVTAANNSALGLKMSTNMQDSYKSFQAAEAGIYGTMALAGTAQDPFNRQPIVNDPFTGLSGAHPLRNVADDPNNPDASNVDVDVILIGIDRTCPRPPGGRGGSSVGVFDCDYYHIQSEHRLPGRARTQVELGVVKTVIGSG